MTTRTAYPGTQSPGDVLTSSNFSKIPGGAIGWAAVTANQGTFTAETDLTSLTVTVTVGTSRLILVTGIVSLSSSAGGDRGTLFIKESSTQLQDASVSLGTGSVGFSVTATVYLVAPSAGSHTYKLAAQRTSGSGNITMTASATAPALIIVRDLGPSS